MMIKFKDKNYDVLLTDKPFCEHCHELEAYNLIFIEKNSHINWCESCAKCDEFFDFNEDEIKKLRIKQYKNKIEYFSYKVEEYAMKLKKLNNNE